MSDKRKQPRKEKALNAEDRENRGSLPQTRSEAEDRQDERNEELNSSRGEANRQDNGGGANGQTSRHKSTHTRETSRQS